ncbi:hypothetical protein [Streptomyces venezuelae]|nr:hypothetical protein [Streptomyces venezuelae]
MSQSTKLRWSLTANKAEVATLKNLAECRGRQEVEYVLAPESAAVA